MRGTYYPGRIPPPDSSYPCNPGCGIPRETEGQNSFAQKEELLLQLQQLEKDQIVQVFHVPFCRAMRKSGENRKRVRFHRHSSILRYTYSIRTPIGWRTRIQISATSCPSQRLCAVICHSLHTRLYHRQVSIKHRQNDNSQSNV